MSAWLQRIIQTLLVIVVAAAIVRLTWELIRPAVPGLVVLLALLLVMRLLWHRSGGW